MTVNGQTMVALAQALATLTKSFNDLYNDAKPVITGGDREAIEAELAKIQPRNDAAHSRIQNF